LVLEPKLLRTEKHVGGAPSSDHAKSADAPESAAGDILTGVGPTVEASYAAAPRVGGPAGMQFGKQGRKLEGSALLCAGKVSDVAREGSQ